MDHTYFAEISWDEEAGVWYISDTDFPGLVAEAASERDLVEKIRALIPELYALNRHLFGEPVLEAIPLRMTSSRLETIRLAG
jgi:predicted RNase H-like HicB family nuclease